MNKLKPYLKDLEKEKKEKNPKETKRKEIIMIRA